MSRYCSLVVPKTLYQNHQADFDPIKDYISNETANTVEIGYEDNNNDDFRKICAPILNKFSDAPFNLTQEQAEGGFDFSSGVDTYIRPGKEPVQVYWDNDVLNLIKIDDVKKCSSFEEVQSLISQHEKMRPTDIEAEAKIYNDALLRGSKKNKPQDFSR